MRVKERERLGIELIRAGGKVIGTPGRGRQGLGCHAKSGSRKRKELHTSAWNVFKFVFRPAAGNERLGDFTPASSGCCTEPPIFKFGFKCTAGNERLGDFTPAFLWLLRDFYLKLEEEGVKV